MNPHDFAVLVAVGSIALAAMCAGAAVGEAVGRRRLAAWLRLDLGPEDDQ